MRDDWRQAAIDGDDAAIVRLLDDGADIDCRDRYGQTALMLAALHGGEAAVRVLLARGAAPDVTAKYNLSALMLAVINGHEPVALRLVAAGADTRIRGAGAPGFHDKTAFDLAMAANLTALAARIARAEG